jgi:hypothetical protein
MPGNTKITREPDTLTVHSGGTLALDGALAVGGQEKATTFTIALAAGAANVMGITVTAKDAEGVTVARPVNFEMWMSEDTGGVGLTADSYSGALAATGGAVLTALTAKKHVIAATAATGIATFTLTDTAKPADQYVCVKNPIDGSVIVSAASGTSWGA